MNAKEYIVSEMTYEGFAGESSNERIYFYSTYEEALAEYERVKELIGDGYNDSFVRLFVRREGNAYTDLLRAYSPDSPSCKDSSFLDKWWNGCELVRDESAIR